MSSAQLDALVRRHEAITEQYRAALLARTSGSSATSEDEYIKEESNSPGLTPEVTSPVTWSPSFLIKARNFQRATVEEIDKEDFPPLNQAPKSSCAIIEDVSEDLIDLGSQDSVASSIASLSPGAGSSRKGKGVDPGNWGGLDNFSEADLHAQREALANYEEINRIQREESTLIDYLGDFVPSQVSSPKVKACKRSRSPKSKKTKVPEAAPMPAVTVPQPFAATVRPKPTAKVAFQKVEPQKVEVPLPAPAQTVETTSAPPPSLTAEEIVALVTNKVIELQLRQNAEERASKANDDLQHRIAESISDRAVPRGATPGRTAALNFFEKALHGASSLPDDPSDDSSSESDESSRHSDRGGNGSS
jgi:hypothetical protein